MMTARLLLAGLLLSCGLLAVPAQMQATDAQDQVQDTTEVSQYFGGVDNEAYLQWASALDLGRSVYLPSSVPNSGAAIHWTVDGGQIAIGVAARAEGWVGFGIAEAGAMPGSDMVLYIAATHELLDAYVLDDIFAGPQPDNCQDWSLLSADQAGGFIMFQATRDLNTGDPQDRPILNDTSIDFPPHRIIAAWGDSETVTAHLPTNRVRTAVRFYGPQGDHEEQTLMLAEQGSEGFLELRAEDYPIKPIDTEYANFCFTMADLVAMGLSEDTAIHAIAFQPVVDADAVAHVHHFTLQAALDPIDGVTQDECNQSTLFRYTVFVWAPGEGTLNLPENVGVQLLGEVGYQSFRLEIHYDNPTLVPGVLDSSGVRVYYTSQLREHDLGVLSVGDAALLLSGQTVVPNATVGDVGLGKHTFTCPETCTSMVLTEPVTVIREYLHMHGTGVRMKNELVRNEEVVKTAAIDFWDFDQNGNAAIQQEPFQLLPGDGFRTTCYYRASHQTVFGYASTQEMCIAFLFYYPRIPAQYAPFLCSYGLSQAFPGFPEACTADYGPQSLSEISQLQRPFGRSCSESAASQAQQFAAGRSEESGANQAEESAASQMQESGSGTSLEMGKLSCMMLLVGLCWIVFAFDP